MPIQMKINKDLIVGDTNYTLGDITTAGKHLLSQEIKTDKTWIDNKPIYRNILQYNIEGNSRHTINIDTLSIDTCIYNNAFIIRRITSGNIDMEGQYHQSDTDYFRTFIRNRTQLEIRSASTYENIAVYVILEYTKTTD